MSSSLQLIILWKCLLSGIILGFSTLQISSHIHQNTHEYPKIWNKGCEHHFYSLHCILGAKIPAAAVRMVDWVHGWLSGILCRIKVIKQHILGWDRLWWVDHYGFYVTTLRYAKFVAKAAVVNAPSGHCFLCMCNAIPYPCSYNPTLE